MRLMQHDRNNFIAKEINSGPHKKAPTSKNEMYTNIKLLICTLPKHLNISRKTWESGEYWNIWLGTTV